MSQERPAENEEEFNKILLELLLVNLFGCYGSILHLESAPTETLRLQKLSSFHTFPHFLDNQ